MYYCVLKEKGKSASLKDEDFIEIKKKKKKKGLLIHLGYHNIPDSFLS